MCVLDAYTHTHNEEQIMGTKRNVRVSLRLDFSTAVKLNEPISGAAFNS